MIDIVTSENGQDMGIQNSQVPKGANVLAVQLRSLEYLPNFGIDLKYFLQEDFRFQNQSFQSYLVEVLANNGINVAKVEDIVHSLYNDVIVNITPEETTTGLIAR